MPKIKLLTSKNFTAPCHFIVDLMACRTLPALGQALAKNARALAHAGQVLVVLPSRDPGLAPKVVSDPEADWSSLAGFPKGLIRSACESGRATIWSLRGTRVRVWESTAPEVKAKAVRASAQLKNIWPREARWLGLPEACGEVMVLPLFTRTPAVGVLVLFPPKKNARWSPQVLTQLSTFARVAGMALEALDQRFNLEERIRQSSAVSEIAQNVNTTLDLDVLMRLILLEMTKAMNCQAGDLWLKDDKRLPVVFQSQVGMGALGQEKPLGGALTEQAMETGEPLLTNLAAPELAAQALIRAGFVSAVIVPLRAKSKVIGVMHLLARKKPVFSRNEWVLLRTLTSQAAMALDNARLFKETKRKAQELLGLYEVAQVISEISNVSAALGQIVERVAGILEVEKCWFMFYDERSGELRAHPQAVGAVEEQLEALRFTLDKPGVSTAVFKTSRPFYSNEAQREAPVQAEFQNVFILRNLMAVPLRSREQTLGVFLAANKQQSDLFTGADVRLFRTLASEATVVIQNANLYDKLRRSYRSLVKVISEMVDAREHFTQGHSERVSRYAALTAKQMGQPEDMVEAVTIAGLLHDLGKVGISQSLLAKPGKLDNDEYRKMQEHAALGEDILENAEIPWDILGLIRHHHEWFNGQGYPDALAGEAIPLGARILAAADAFDVMVNERVYQKARTPQAAWEELKRGAGRQFDPVVIKAFEEAWQASGSQPEAVTGVQNTGFPFSDKS
ncbi:MAG: GAF domain-containing protein [Candidatus Firestonebacteria bacterium]|nr:GAF domain-containing protein [Candidatus Firestonebacteria bacterium]